jgi:hypothetical protein
MSTLPSTLTRTTSLKMLLSKSSKNLLKPNINLNNEDRNKIKNIFYDDISLLMSKKAEFIDKLSKEEFRF